MNPIDKKIREKFQNHQTTVDTDALWKEVYPSIKKKRKPYLGFLLIAVLSISATSFIWYINTNIDAHSSKDIIQQNTQASNNLIEEPTAQIFETNKNEKEEVQGQVEETKLEKTIETTSLQQQKTRDNILKKHVQRTEVIKEQVYSKEEEKDHKSFSKYSAPTTNNRLTKKREREEVIPNKPIIEALKAETIVASLKQAKTKNQPRQNFKSPQLQKENKSVVFESTLWENIPEVSVEEARADWFINPSFGLFLTSRKLQSNVANSSEITALKIAERNEKESQLESAIAELAIGRKINDKWGASFGLNYRESNELSKNAIQTLDTVLKDDILIEIRNMPNGMQEEIYGSAQVPQTIISQEGRYTKYQSVSAFADLFYRFQTKKINWQAELGLQQSVWLGARGHIIDGEAAFYDLTEDSENKLANNGGLSLRTGLGVLIPIDNKWSFHAKARFIKDFNSLLSMEYEIIQKYQLLGISVGAQLAF